MVTNELCSILEGICNDYPYICTRTKIFDALGKIILLTTDEHQSIIGICNNIIRGYINLPFGQMEIYPLLCSLLNKYKMSAFELMQIDFEVCSFVSGCNNIENSLKDIKPFPFASSAYNGTIIESYNSEYDIVKWGNYKTNLSSFIIAYIFGSRYDQMEMPYLNMFLQILKSMIKNDANLLYTTLSSSITIKEIIQQLCFIMYNYEIKSDIAVNRDIACSCLQIMNTYLKNNTSISSTALVFIESYAALSEILKCLFAIDVPQINKCLIKFASILTQKYINAFSTTSNNILMYTREQINSSFITKVHNKNPIFYLHFIRYLKSIFLYLPHSTDAITFKTNIETELTKIMPLFNRKIIKAILSYFKVGTVFENGEIKSAELLCCKSDSFDEIMLESLRLLKCILRFCYCCSVTHKEQVGQLYESLYIELSFFISIEVVIALRSISLRIKGV